MVRARRNRFYERGLQHVYEDWRAPGVFIQGTPGAVVPFGDGEYQCGQYIDDYNIFGRALQIIIAKLTENPAGINFEADSADVSADEQAAEAAEGYKLLFDRRNETKDLLTAIVRMMGLDGRTVTWTHDETDAEKWGSNDDGTPRVVQITEIFGVLESKVPILAKCLKLCPYLILSDDPHVFIAKSDYPDFADKISEEGDQGIVDSQFERMARIGVLQGQTASFQISDTYAWYPERKRVFFRPSVFLSKHCDSAYRDEQHLEETNDDGSPRNWTLRDALREAFPAGVMTTFIGPQYVGSRNVCMDAECAADFPYAGDGMARMAIMDPAVVIQDDFNDDMNAYHSVKVTGWPSTWLNEDTADLAAINDQIAEPYAFRALKNRPPRDVGMEKQFFREPDPNIPATFMQHTEYMATQLLQFILAIPSAVQGAGMPDQKTASGYTAALQQALGQLGVIWGAVKRLMARVYYQAAKLAANSGSDPRPIVIPGPRGAMTVDIAALKGGRFLAHPDTDSSYPESTMQQRAVLQMIFELGVQIPAVAEALLSSPDNWDTFLRVFGFQELVIPEARARKKQVAEAEILLQQVPIEPDPQEVEIAMAAHQQADQALAASGGQPTPFDPASMLRSSIPVDPLDYHEWEFEECREILSDYPRIQRCLSMGEEGIAGVQNLRLHAQEHQKFMVSDAQAKAAMIAQTQQPKQPKQIGGAKGQPQPGQQPQEEQPANA